MLRKLHLLFIPAIILSASALSFGQSADSTAKFNLSGYIDAYYAFYTDSMDEQYYQQFPSVSPRSNQFGLNSALLTAQYDAEKVRGIVTLHYGDIPLSAWSSTYNPIMEAHAGIRLCKKVWMDAGFFRTHVGTEGLLPKENIASSISINTYYEPYFESGVRFNYIPSEKLSLNLFLLNGYNIYVDNNDKKSIGLLINYTINDKLNIGYSNYIGDDADPYDSLSRLRIHNAAFINYQSGKIKLQAGGDFCYQQHAAYASGKSATDAATMMSGIISAKYLCCKKTSVYARGEYFNDKEGFMSMVFFADDGAMSGLKILGGTLGVEYKPTENSYIRLEARDLMADEEQQLFYWNNENTNTRFESMINMGISF